MLTPWGRGEMALNPLDYTTSYLQTFSPLAIEPRHE